MTAELHVKKSEDGDHKATSENSKIPNSASKKTSSKTNTKQEWAKYCCFMNEKERQKLMELPELPHQKKSSKKIKSKFRERSASSNKTSSVTEKQNNKKENKQDSSDSGDSVNLKNKKAEKSSSSSSEDEDKSSKDTVTRNSKKEKVKKTISFNSDLETSNKKNGIKRSEPNEIENEKIETLRKPWFKPPARNFSISRPDLDKSESENELNNTNLAKALISLQYNQTYKNLVRSMRANL